MVDIVPGAFRDDLGYDDWWVIVSAGEEGSLGGDT